MGKSKKTRWRTFEISGSQDETQTNGADVKVNGTETLDSNAPVTSQKYSQILGDHHTNSSQHNGRNSSSHHIYNKSRGYNNKENFYNQRSSSGRPSASRSWQRNGTYRTVNGKDKKSDENDKAGSNDAKVDSTAEPIKFNEDEYTRITTPRQDVLFKKGYLSRMNSNKTASNLSATVNSTESTAASSTITTSDPDSSVSTLSPATTPSMDYGQLDSMDYAPMYYPGYYDENGMLMIPMYNGYNYYPPPSGSAATSPVFLMPYPYQYDPFFMTPSGIQPVDGDENVEEKTESDGAKENNHNAENQNGASTTSSEDGASSNSSEEKKEETKEDEKEVEQNGDANSDEIAATDPANSDIKQHFPIYPNELNGYMYPAYPNGYYNNFYYYNGAPQPRPPKMRRRKRFLNSRSSHNHQQQPRSAETTTDYSDDDNNTATSNKRYTPRYHNGWSYHHNGYNQYNGKFHRVFVDQNANQAPNEFHLNVDVQEFYPRVQLSEDKKVNCDETPIDLERKQPTTTTAPSPKPKVETIKVTKTSHPPKPRVSKKEIIEGIKSMEQQNIDLMASKHQMMTNTSPIDEWNVIKKGKKVKVVKEVVKSETPATSPNDVKKDIVEEMNKEESKTEVNVSAPEAIKRSTAPAAKIKKSKSKNKKKKSHQVVKQVGFEIIEPEFNNSPAVELDESQELSEEETEIIESEIQEILTTEPEVEVESVLHEVVEQEIVATSSEIVEESPKVIDLPEAIKKNDEDDAVIDISDEDICCKMSGPLDIEVVKEVERIVEMVNHPELFRKEIPVKQEVQEEIQVIKKVQPEVETTQVQKTPETAQKVEKTPEPQEVETPILTLDPFQDSDFFSDRTNIAALERDLMENLRLLDDEFDLKTPIINPLYDFPITSAVQRWLQEKQNESFDSLFHVQNFKKLSELCDDEEDEDDEDETESDISEKELKSETDSDYASDFQAKANGASPTCSTHAKGSSSKCNKLLAAKESFCALM